VSFFLVATLFLVGTSFLVVNIFLDFPLLMRSYRSRTLHHRPRIFELIRPNKHPSIHAERHSVVAVGGGANHVVILFIVGLVEKSPSASSYRFIVNWRKPSKLIRLRYQQ
jgi:hypothetical protein